MILSEADRTTVAEVASRAFVTLANTHGIHHIPIEPGRSMRNGYIDSFNGKFRDECLNEQWFETMQLGKLVRWHSLATAVRANLVVVLAPERDGRSGLLQRLESLFV